MKGYLGLVRSNNDVCVFVCMHDIEVYVVVRMQLNLFMSICTSVYVCVSYIHVSLFIFPHILKVINLNTIAQFEAKLISTRLFHSSYIGGSLFSLRSAPISAHLFPVEERLWSRRFFDLKKLADRVSRGLKRQTETACYT